jgi:hypothetical protein
MIEPRFHEFHEELQFIMNYDHVCLLRYEKATVAVPPLLNKSLIQPNYDTQPVNPVTDTVTYLKTPFILSMISNHIANQPTIQQTAEERKEKDVTPFITKPMKQ